MPRRPAQGLIALFIILALSIAIGMPILFARKRGGGGARAKEPAYISLSNALRASGKEAGKD